jgi:hypothetical protein
MAMRSSISAKLFLAAWSLWLATSSAQEVQTLELATSAVHPLTARLGNACLIQLPAEPLTTNVGDPQMWLVEKAERLVSIKPTHAAVRDTNLAVVTRQGTLNFFVHLAPDTDPFTQMVRITRIVDDSKPLPPAQGPAQDTLADAVIREIRVAQNYYALKQVNAPELRDVEQFTQMRETETRSHRCTLLQTFHFRGTRHIVLHFLMQNRTEAALTFDHRKTIVSIGETLFAPTAVSLGRTTLPPKASAESFIVLDGSNGLSPRQVFEILLPMAPSPSPAL